MQEIRKQDPTFTAYVPRTAAEAVERYTRCRRNGLKPCLVPECLIECARGLDEEQVGLFESWIINPVSDLDDVKLVPDTIRDENEKIYQENCRRVEDELPPLPVEQDDEKQLVKEVLNDLIESVVNQVEQRDRPSTSSPRSTPST